MVKWHVLRELSIHIRGRQLLIHCQSPPGLRAIQHRLRAVERQRKQWTGGLSVRSQNELLIDSSGFGMVVGTISIPVFIGSAILPFIFN